MYGRCGGAVRRRVHGAARHEAAQESHGAADVHSGSGDGQDEHQRLAQRYDAHRVPAADTQLDRGRLGYTGRWSGNNILDFFQMAVAQSI